MTTRRKVLQTGMAIAAAAAAPGLSTLAATGDVAGNALPLTPGPAMPLYKVAYDGRFSAAAIFGAHARRLGADVHDIDGDITGLWYQHLYRRWRQSPAPVAGMSAFSSLLGLQMMASAAGLRVICRAHHHRDAQRVSHELFGPNAILVRAARLRGPEDQWARAAADLVMSWPAGLAPVARAHSTILDAGRRALSSDSLITWILAPVRTAPIRAA